MEALQQESDAPASVGYLMIAGAFLLLTFPSVLVAGLGELVLSRFDLEHAREVAGVVIAACLSGAAWMTFRAAWRWLASSKKFSVGWADDLVIALIAIAWQLAIAKGAVVAA
jgi:hypothetical protein